MAFHWLTALLFTIQFPIGYAIGLNNSASKTLLSTHMILGLTLFWIVVARALYRLSVADARISPTLAPWHAITSKIIHFAIYLILLGVPILGWLGSEAAGGTAVLGWFSLPPAWSPGDTRALLLLYWHGVMAFTLLAAVFIHIAVAMQGYLENGQQKTVTEYKPSEITEAASLQTGIEHA